MTSFALFSEPQVLVHSAGAAASLSIEDANFDGVKHHDINKVDTCNKNLTLVVAAVAATGVIFGLTAMYLEASIIAYLAFAFPLITAPTVITQRKKIQWLPTFREESHKLRLSVEDMALERNKLTGEVSRLERQVKRMSGSSRRFEQLVARENKDLESLMALVHENAKILDEKEKLLAATEMMDLFSLILKSDRDEDGRISEDELDRFMLRMKAFGGRRGNKDFNQDSIRAALKNSISKGNIALFNALAPVALDREAEPTDIEAQAPTTQAAEEPVQQLRKIPAASYVAPAQLVEQVPAVNDQIPPNMQEYSVKINATASSLQVSNTVSMKSDSGVPANVFATSAEGENLPDIKSNESLLIDTLLGSNSMFEATKTDGGLSPLPSKKQTPSEIMMTNL